jgi:hypothetical protein
MDNIVEVLKQVRDELGLAKDAEIRYCDDGRWLCADAYTFILASKEHQNISFWAEMHKKITHVSWLLVQQKSLENLEKNKSYPSYQLLAKCSREPEIEIILNKKYGDVAVVAYTDSTYPILLEQKQIKGEKIDPRHC